MTLILDPEWIRFRDRESRNDIGKGNFQFSVKHSGHILWGLLTSFLSPVACKLIFTGHYPALPDHSEPHIGCLVTSGQHRSRRQEALSDHNVTTPGSSPGVCILSSVTLRYYQMVLCGICRGDWNLTRADTCYEVMTCIWCQVTALRTPGQRRFPCHAECHACHVTGWCITCYMLLTTPALMYLSRVMYQCAIITPSWRLDTWQVTLYRTIINTLARDNVSFVSGQVETGHQKQWLIDDSGLLVVS